MNGWVVERYLNNELRYWGGRAAGHFTPQNAEAIRFARAEDANLVLAWLCEGHGRAVEHVWHDVASGLKPLRRSQPLDVERLGIRAAEHALESLLSLFDFDGADPNTFTIAELRRAI